MADPVILETERLILRPPLPDDAAQIVELLSVKDVAWNLGTVPYPYSLDDANSWLAELPKRWAEDKGYIFAITQDGDRVMGMVSLMLRTAPVWELGYWLGKRFWHEGYMTEAAGGLMNWARADMGLTHFASGHFVDNHGSGRVLTKLGFRPVGEYDLFGLARGAKQRSLRYVLGTDPDLALRIVPH